MKNINKIRVSLRRLCAITFFSTLTIGFICVSDNTKIERVDTESVALIDVTTMETTTTTSTTTTTLNTQTTSNETTTTTIASTTPIIVETCSQELLTEIITTEVVMVEESNTEMYIEEQSNDTLDETITDTNEEYIGSFSRGTFYTTGSYGGSGRTLVSGYSIASRAIYEMYGYGNYEIRIECDSFPELNGIYSLDDCSAEGNYEVIDFWFAPNDVPAYFREIGVVEVRAYIIYH